MAHLTILIAARNAAETIRRAVSSCVGERVPICLIDDNSTDNTVELALSVGHGLINVVKCAAPGGVSAARQAGLDVVDTPYAAWLDADDEWIPGRAQRLVAALDAGADIVSDAIELYDGASGTFLRSIGPPAFLRSTPFAWRLFERNYLPGDTQVGFRVESFRNAGGYDPTIYGPESYDVLLRCVANGATFSYLDQPGYRMYAYDASVSRQLSRQRDAVRSVLSKHDYAMVRSGCNAQCCPSEVTGWILFSMAIFRCDYQAAFEFLDETAEAAVDKKTLLEPDGPCRQSEAWRQAFYRGTLSLLSNDDIEAAASFLRDAEEITPTAEGANNLGVAMRLLGQTDASRACFDTALNRFQGYRDASINLDDADARTITTHALRQQPSRSEYTADAVPS